MEEEAAALFEEPFVLLFVEENTEEVDENGLRNRREKAPTTGLPPGCC